LIEKRQKGTYYEMGVELGKRLHENNYEPPVLPAERLKLAEGCEVALKQFAPQLHEELLGVVEGAQLEETHFKAFMLSLSAYPRPACSILAISPDFTESSQVLFGRNYDWEMWVHSLFQLCWTEPEGALASLSCTDLFVGRYGGINEAGLAMGLTAIPGYMKDEPGIMLHLVARWILDNSHNVKEALNFFKRIPHVRGNNYLVADKTGAIALVEAAPEKVSVTHVNSGLIVATNHFQSAAMKRLENNSYIPPSSVPRLKYITNWFSKRTGKISEAQVQQILKGNIEHGKGVMQHQFRNGTEWGTVWSWSTHVGDRRLHIADGTWTGASFKEYSY
jgi:predicted choloylglycine hydrolase